MERKKKWKDLRRQRWRSSRTWCMIGEACKFCSIESRLGARLSRMGVPAVACASRIPCLAPVQSLWVLVTACLRTLCVRAQYESVLHLFENNSGPDGVYRLRLQSAHKPPGPQLLLYLAPETIYDFHTPPGFIHCKEPICFIYHFRSLSDSHKQPQHVYFPHCSRYCSRQRPFSWMSWAYSLPTYR